jgi:hypothetical protein
LAKKSKGTSVNTPNIHAIALAASIAFSGGAMAQNVSKDEYLSVKDMIAADYKLAKASCDSLSGNPNDICMANAKGNANVALADLEAGYKPTPETHYQAHVARAEANYALAKERCNDRAGSTKDACMQEAKSLATVAMADAKAQMKTADANATEKSADAGKDATVAKLDAQYKVTREKCDTYAGNAKDNCVNAAKVRFSQ